MALHIVTAKCFLACEKVTSVVIQEYFPEKPLPRRKRKQKKGYGIALEKEEKPKAKKPRGEYTVTISYYPLSTNGTFGQNSNREPSEFTLDITVYSKKEAFDLYTEIIKEVQEQHPNEAYLDKLVDKLLKSDSLTVDKEPEEIKDGDDDW